MYIDNLKPNLGYVVKSIGKVILYLILVDPIWSIMLLRYLLG